MDSKDKQKLMRFFVFLVIAGLVLAYVPLFFVPQPAPVSLPQSENSAQLIQPETQTETEKSETLPSAEEESPTAEGLNGLEEESESLEELNKLLEKAGN